jgi:hypothetical protein
MGYVEIVENGRRRLKELGVYDRYFTRGVETGATLRINREFFNTIRLKFNLIDAQPASPAPKSSEPNLRRPYSQPPSPPTLNCRRSTTPR